MRWAPLLGAAQLAVGRGEGITRFADTPAAFLGSLAPLVAFPLVGSLFLLADGRVLQAVAFVLLTVLSLAGPAVLSHAIAVRWGREADWLRYATAFNWCQWAVPVAAMGLLAGLQLGAGAGLTAPVAVQLLVVGVGAYYLWLHWTVTRHGLDLSRGRSALLVVLVNAGMAALLVIPQLLAQVLG